MKREEKRQIFQNLILKTRISDSSESPQRPSRSITRNYSQPRKNASTMLKARASDSKSEIKGALNEVPKEAFRS